MTSTTQIVLYAWFGLAPFLFACLPARRAIIAGYVLAWLFLPISVLDTPFVDVDKYVAASIGVVIGLLLFAKTRFGGLRFSYWDLPIAVWCACPIATSFQNDLGLYDGISAGAHRALMWGVPYVLARTYLADKQGVRDLALGVLYGGLLYVPLCLFEIRMSPKLHLLLYGYHQHAFLQTLRTIGGYRPMVFMHHGLMLGLWMTTASLVGIVLWRSGTLPRIGRWNTKWFVVALIVTTIMCQSVGALVLLVIGLGAYVALRRFPRATIALLVATPVLYCAARVGGAWDGNALVRITRNFSEERASSLAYRLSQEEVLCARAWEQPVLGWGGFNRAFPPPNGSDFRPAVSDSLWIVVFGMNGLVGLFSVVLTCLAPILIAARRWRPAQWLDPDNAPVTALSIVLGLYLMDGMVNMMVNPVFMLAAGSLTGYAMVARARAPAVARDPRAVALAS